VTALIHLYLCIYAVLLGPKERAARPKEGLMVLEIVDRASRYGVPGHSKGGCPQMRLSFTMRDMKKRLTNAQRFWIGEAIYG
jgi:hypothetical protein